MYNIFIMQSSFPEGDDEGGTRIVENMFLLLPAAPLPRSDVAVIRFVTGIAGAG